MAKKKVTAIIKLQCPAQKATPAPPIGPALGPHGVSAPQFVQQFNEKTRQFEAGLTIPVVITVYADRSFSFILKTPPAAVLIKKALGLETASGVPNKQKVGTLTQAQLEEIAKGYEGVQQAYAMQAGREIRVMVVPERVSDADAVRMAQQLREQIETTMTYPGQIKVSVIREYRANELAK